MLHANSSGHKNPFMAGSLLQQRVEAEKQEIENMKMQLKLREQAGVLGSRQMDSNNNNDPALLSPGLLTSHYQQGGHGRGLSSTSSSTSISSATTPAYSYQHHQKQQQTLLSQFSPPKFGGPGTLIEQGEVRAAQLSRSKSAGTGLLRPSNGVNSTISNTSSNGQRTRSKSRGPAEDRVAYGSRPISPSSPRSPDFAPPMPQGPLLQFADADAMIQPGLLLDRARSTKQQQQSSYSSNQMRPSASSRRPGAGQSHSQSQSAGTRGRVKPLIDLGNIHTGPDVIGPGLLTNGHNNYTTTSSSSHAHNNGSSRSPRRTKPLLEF
ncbi:hypothetical protein BGZ95_004865 [Linnemannia exigua]|uniref:Uncharacterized protein n=1 Tax=Linnemannia exigua TaxID=604196 RepID=A0AAD4H7V9_9FUNG|nr:hypothetical protein BGZ95_004865 [Linnemannia exigua]